MFTHLPSLYSPSPSLPNLVIHTLLLNLVPILLFTLPPFRYRLFLTSLSTLYLATTLSAKIKVYKGTNPGFILYISSNWFIVIRILAYTLPGKIPEHIFFRQAQGETLGEATNWGFGWKKFIWSATLLLGDRNWGWNHECKNIPNKEAAVNKTGEFDNRFKFLMIRIGRFVFWTMALEATLIYQEKRPSTIGALQVSLNLSILNIHPLSIS